MGHIRRVFERALANFAQPPNHRAVVATALPPALSQSKAAGPEPVEGVARFRERKASAHALRMRAAVEFRDELLRFSSLALFRFHAATSRQQASELHPERLVLLDQRTEIRERRSAHPRQLLRIRKRRRQR